MRHRRTGFTLIKMLLVMVILGILVMFVAPKIDLETFTVDAAMQSAGTTLLTAHRRAVTHPEQYARGHYVEVDPTNLDVATYSAC